MSNYVLVPGAWLGGWAWRKIAPGLRSLGNDVYNVTLTGMGERVHLASPDYGYDVAAQDVINLIEYEGLKDVVLVGHSFAGRVVSLVADRIPERISLIIFLDADRPRKGTGPQGGSDEWAKEDLEGVKKFMDETGDGWKFILEDDVLERSGKDLHGEDLKWFWSKVTPWPARLLLDPISLSGKIDGVKKAYILCTSGGDDINKILEEGLDGPHRIIDSGHWPMITKPDELVEAMNSLVQEQSGRR